MRFILVAAIAAALAGCGGPAKPENAAAELKPHMEKVYAAWGTLDVAQPGQYYSKDKDILFFDIAPMKYTGFGEFADGFKKISSNWKSVKFTIGPDFQAFKKGDIAWTAGTLHADVTLADGTTEKIDARASEVLEKRDDKWVIVSEHISMPLPEVQKQEPTPKPAAKPHKTSHKKSKKH
jgi:ketosteroid isomerase-like protein